MHENENLLWVIGLVAAVSALILAVVYLRLIWNRHKPLPSTISLPAKGTYLTLEFNSITPFAQKSRRLEDQTSLWQERMHSHGNQLQRHQVAGIIFAHGTFVGIDPWGVTHLLRERFPRIRSSWLQRIHKVNRQHSNRIMGDHANFLPEYVKLVEQSLCASIPCREFHWASGNYHAARLTGAFELIEDLGRYLRSITPEKSERILLIGHSHAGQVFALFSHLVEHTELGQQLSQFSARLMKRPEELPTMLADCKRVSFDFVTMGSPILYPWAPAASKRLMHIVNHRGHSPLAGRRRGAPFTREGDYIHQWGTLGSDFVAMAATERSINRELDQVLGEGLNRRQWGANRRLRSRISPYGFTYLVDFGDHSVAMPNFFRTILGHGVYTRFEAMEFNFSLICKHFYS